MVKSGFEFRQFALQNPCFVVTMFCSREIGVTKICLEKLSPGYMLNMIEIREPLKMFEQKHNSDYLLAGTGSCDVADDRYLY